MRKDALHLLAIADAEKNSASRSQFGRSELNRPHEAQSEEWETVLFFAAISSPALFFVVREVFGILGK